MIGHTLDATGLSCPLPFLKLRRTLRDLPAGTCIEVLSTDPLAPSDFDELCGALGHKLISHRREGAVTHTLILVAAAAASAGALPESPADVSGLGT